MKKFLALVAHTWLFIRKHDWTEEPETQRRARLWFVSKVHDLQYEPYTQWKYHLRMSWLWVFAVIPTTVMLGLLLFGSDRIEHILIGVMLGWNAYLSLYANFDTEFSGVHAAWAAMRGDQIAEKQDVAMAESHIIEHVEEVEKKIYGDGEEVEE